MTKILALPTARESKGAEKAGGKSEDRAGIVGRPTVSRKEGQSWFSLSFAVAASPLCSSKSCSMADCSVGSDSESDELTARSSLHDKQCMVRDSLVEHGRRVSAEREEVAWVCRFRR